MELKEAYQKYKKLKVPSLSVIREKASKHSKTSLFIVVLFVVFLALALQYIPYFQVAHFGITNSKDLADAENSYRATLAQILGGIAIGIGLYFTWKKVIIAQDGQITERFTRAVDQLGAIDPGAFDPSRNKKLEIRLGGIYALERISKESKEDYWPIMEILTAYIRENSSIKNGKRGPVYEDIQAILTVIGRRKDSITKDVYALNLCGTNLQGAKLSGAALYGINLEEANLGEADLNGTKLRGSSLAGANLQGADLDGIELSGAYLKGVDLRDANLEKADLQWANLEDAKNLTIDQLSKVKTLYNAKLDEELLIPLKEKYPALFDEPKYET